MARVSRLALAVLTAAFMFQYLTCTPAHYNGGQSFLRLDWTALQKALGLKK